MLSLLFLDIQIFFPSIFLNLSQISFHYKFLLLLSLSAQEGIHCSLPPSLLTTYQVVFLMGLQVSMCVQAVQHRNNSPWWWPKPRGTLLCPFLFLQPEYLIGKRKAPSLPALELRPNSLVVTQARSPASSSPSLADAFSDERRSAFLTL